MVSRAIVFVGFAAILAGVAGCHKQAPPVVQPNPVAPPPPPPPTAGPNRAAPPPTSGPSNIPDDGAARGRAAEAVMGTMIHFDYNEATLSAEDKTILDAKATLLRANPTAHVQITGNCDERGSDQYNIALGMRRAAVAKEYLTVAGIDGARIEVASLGREKPLDNGNTEASWAKNRRDEFAVTAGTLR